MSKYNRNQPSISRNADEHLEEDHWLKQFEKNLEKSAVQPRSVDNSLFNQINSIMNGSQSKYPSVAAAVEDMKKRSGLTDYLDKVRASEETNHKKTAQNTQVNNSLPTVIKSKPEIARTFENVVTESHGYLPAVTIIEKVKSIHHNDVSDDGAWDEDKLAGYVSNLNLQEKSKHSVVENYQDLGRQDHDSAADIDPSNNDAFHALMPATKV